MSALGVHSADKEVAPHNEAAAAILAANGMIKAMSSRQKAKHGICPFPSFFGTILMGDITHPHDSKHIFIENYPVETPQDFDILPGKNMCIQSERVSVMQHSNVLQV